MNKPLANHELCYIRKKGGIHACRRFIINSLLDDGSIIISNEFIFAEKESAKEYISEIGWAFPPKPYKPHEVESRWGTRWKLSAPRSEL